MKIICGNFFAKKSTRKVFALVFIYINPHPAYSIEWHVYALFTTMRIWTYVAYMRQSVPKLLQTLRLAWKCDWLKLQTHIFKFLAICF